MTDTLIEEAPAEDEVPNPLQEDEPNLLTCDQCDFATTYPAVLGSHRYQRHGVRGASRRGSGRKRKAPADKAPPSVQINLGPGKVKADDLAKVEERVNQLLGIVAGGLVMLGQAEDAGDIVRGRATVAMAAKELAQYEPWLRKLCQGGENTGRVLAWVAMAVALVGMLVPILHRHGVVPPELAQMLGQMQSFAPTADAGAAA